MALDSSKRDHVRAVMALDQRAATVQQQEAAMAEAKAAAATKSKELDLREVGTNSEVCCICAKTAAATKSKKAGSATRSEPDHGSTACVPDCHQIKELELCKVGTAEFCWLCAKATAAARCNLSESA